MDYYKLRKILIIVCIVSTCLRIIGSTKVFAADDVNSSIQSGNYVVQTDNHYETIKNISRDAQKMYCTLCLELLNSDNIYYVNQMKDSITYLYNEVYKKKSNTCFFYIVNNKSGFYCQVVDTAYITNSNITISGYTWDDCYNFNNVPFLQITRNRYCPLYYINGVNGYGAVETETGTSSIMPIPALGFLSDLWIDVFSAARSTLYSFTL